jgi:hypothetical protein
VPDTSEGGGSTDSDVDDPQINAWLRDKANIGSRGNRLKQENLIDWMLSRTRTIGAKNTRRQLPAAVMTRTQSPSKLDATSNQHSDVQQTVPSLHQPPEDITNITVLARHRVRGRGQPLVTAQKKRKLRHERGQASLHFFTSDKTHITSGRRRRHAITIDIEDEAFYKALAPVLRNTTDQPQTETTLLPVRAITRKQHMSVNVRHAELPGYQSSSRHRNIKLDFDIKRLPSGITFDSSTYIGRGWLHELAILVSGNAEISEPDAYAAHGIELIPTMTVSHFATVFTLLCDRLFDATSAAELFHWEALMHAVCQFVSWLPISANDEDCHFLQSSVQEQLLGLITRVNDWHRSPASSVNASVAVYTIHWFAIEVSVRLNHSLRRRLGDLASDTHVTNEFILLLMWHLLDFGWTRTLEPIQDCREHLDARSTAQRTAELWICLINLLGRSDVTQDHLGRGSFWQITQQCLESGHSVPSGLEASELAWQTIFALCTLSQFSSYGMTTSKSRLSGSWELVCFALKQIRLAAEPDSDRSLSERSLDKRDDYIWLVVSRCFILWNRWHWCLDNASEMFRHLADVFRSRKFANLRREPSDFPGFMLNNDVRLLSQYKPSDTAFELFLKLIVHAARSGPDANNDLQPEHASIKVNKLLSLIVPVGSVPFTKTTPPSVRELSMLYNRFGAIAVALYLDASPGNVHSRLSQARAYVKFKDADDMTRIACIRGAMHFAILMQDRQMPLDAVLLWLGDISMILVNEYSDIRDGKSTSHSTNMVRDRLIFSIQVLLGSVRRIIETPHMNPTKSRSVYPDPGLLEGGNLLSS